MIAPIFFIILYIFVPECASADSTEPNNNKGECKIKNFSDSDWKVFKKLDLNDNDAEKTIFTAEYSDELEVEQCVLATGPQIRDYFTFEVKDKLFQIETTAKLKELDEIIPRQTEDYVNAYISCSLKCPKGETVVKFRFDIKDINEHAPTFGESEYTYSVPTPLMPESDLTRYGKSVIVEDLDFSNNNITFSIDPDDFEINAVPVENSKKYVAEFAAKKVLFLKEPKEYTLTATDDGKDPGPLSNKVKVKVTVDSDTSIDTPSFSTPSYTFEYQVTDGKPTLIPKSGPITIDSSKFNELEITVSGDLKDQIKATLNKDKKEIEISIETPITTLASFVAFTIDVKTDLTTSALVVIHMPEITLEFDTHLITGDYDPTTKQLNMHQKVTLKSTEEAKVSLSGDESDYLSLVTDKSSNSYSIAIKEGKSIPEEDLKGKKSLSLTITATLGEKTDKASVLIYLPANNLKFTNTLYTASYDAKKKTVTVEKNPITFSNKVDAVTITVDDTYKDFFQIIYDTKDQKGEVKVVKELTTEILSAGKPLILEITATDSDKNEAKAVLEITIPKINGPEFKKAYYEVTYPKDGKSPISVDFDFETETDPSKVEIKLEDAEYEKNFKIEYLNKKWQITILSPLSIDTLEKIRDLKILIVATEAGITLSGHSVLIISLPEIKGPQFTESVYIVEYPKDGKGPIKFQKNLNFEDGVVVDSIDISDYKDNFSIDKEDDLWEIKIKTGLDLEKLKDQTELILTMTAKEKDNTETGTASLIIKLPHSKNDGPRFKEAYYTLTYPKDAKDGSTLDFSQIAFENVADESKLTISLGGYKENFDVTRDETTMKWEIRITKALDPKILEEKTELLITMTIEEDGKTTNAAAVLVLKLPDEKTITFKNQFYIAAYPKSGTGKIQFDKAIEFSNLENSKEVSITVKDYAENFELSYDDAAKKWVLNVKKPLEKTIINAKNELVIVLEAAFTGFKAGTATLVVEIEKEISTSPKFSKSLYEADYPTNGKDNIALDSLDFENVEDKSKVVVSVPGYETNFKFVLDPKTSKWHIEIVEPLKNENLQEKTDLRLILLATEEGLKTESALILNLPSKSGEKAPKFKNDYYTADYPKTAKVDDEIIIQKALEFSNVAELEKVAIQLEDHSDNFEIYYNAEKKWVLKIKKILDNEESSKELVTTIYATQTDEKGTGKAVLVVKLPSAETEEGPEFSETSYTGEYKKENDKYVVDLKKKIVVTSTKSTDKILVTMLQTERNFNVNKYFSLEKGSDSYTIKVKENLSDLLLSRKYLTITIQAELDDKKSTALLIINLPTQDTTGLAKFDKVLYKGQYSENKFVYDSMQVITELEDEKVQVKLEDDSYNDIFKVSYAHKIVKIEILKPLPSENKISLVLDILVGEKVQSSAVLEITNSGEQNSIQFDKLVYNGEYNLKEETLKVEKITLRTSLAEDKIKVSISDYKDYFTAQLKDSVLTITLTKALPATILKDKHFLSLTIDVTAEGLTETVSATLNIDLIDPNVDTVVNFDKSIYNAQLNLTEDNKEFSYEPIDLTVSPSSGQVTVAVAEAYQAIFDVKLDNQKVKISLKSTADVSKLHNLTNIAVELRASVPGTKASTFAVLNVEILGDHPPLPPGPGDFNKTPYIVAISLLSVSLIVLTAGAIAFYYFKIRRKDYTEVDEEIWKVRFDKSSMSRPSDGRKGSALEGRRPTGFVFNPPQEDEENPRESTTDGPERRKSVLFDNKVEKREIDSALDEEDEKEKKNGIN